MSLSELELEPGLRGRLCRRAEFIIGSCGGPTGLELIAPELCIASRFLGGRPGRFGGPVAFGFFLENRIEVRRPTSDASVEAVAVISGTREKVVKVRLLLELSHTFHTSTRFVVDKENNSFKTSLYLFHRSPGCCSLLPRHDMWRQMHDVPG